MSSRNASETLADQLAQLYQRINYEGQHVAGERSFTLDSMAALVSRLGDPHLRYPVIHVAGTKGKGSVVTMIGEILTHSDRRTGVYTSPHLESINQRMAIDGRLISDSEFSEVLTQMQPVVEQLDREQVEAGLRPLTFFEITTAAMFVWFADQKVDVAILEVGMGGRLDSTNVCRSCLSVITGIGLDHTRQLGSTVDRIAREKAGIIKQGVPVISGATDPAAADVIREVAETKQSKLHELDVDFHIHTDEPDSLQCSGEIEKPFSVGGLKPAMPGQHQSINAAIAVAACQALRQQGWKISDQSIGYGIGHATLAGRTEIFAGPPTVILDMAHNGISAAALATTLVNDIPEWQAARRRRLVIATTRDKKIDEIVGPLVSLADEVVLTRYQNNPRGVAINDLEHCVDKILNPAGGSSVRVLRQPTPSDTWDYLCDTLQPGDAICIAGSAFLIAEMRPLVSKSLQPRRS